MCDTQHKCKAIYYRGLPVEIINLIVECLDESKPTLKTCALVSHVFLIPSRRSLFKHKISLSQNQIRSFLELCDDRLSTIPNALSRTRELHIYHDPWTTDNALPEAERLQNYLVFDKFFTWRKSEPDGTEWTVPSMFTNLKIMTIESMGWWVLSEHAKRALYEGFRSVEELRLLNMYFKSGERFLMLIRSFPALEALRLDGVRVSPRDNQADPVPASVRSDNLKLLFGAMKPTPVLRSLDLRNIHVGSALIIDALVTLSHSVRVLRCQFENLAGVHSSGNFPGLKKLLVSAGAALEELSVVQQASSMSVDGIDLDTFLRDIDLSSNIRIQRITFCVGDVATIVPVRNHIAHSSTSPAFDSPSLKSFDVSYPVNDNVDCGTAGPNNPHLPGLDTYHYKYGAVLLRRFTDHTLSSQH